MIFYAYDYDNYCDWRGFYYDYSEFTPGPVVQTEDELLNSIKNIDTQFDKQKSLISKKNSWEAAMDTQQNVLLP